MPIPCMDANSNDPKPKDTEAIKSFYDDFLESRMLDYRVHGNLRLDKAADRISQFVRPDSNVFDIGCGIGMVPERVAGELNEGHVWACDISKRNIWYAKRTVDAPNVTFFAADIMQNIDEVKQALPEPVDMVTLVDVIEHIPQEKHSALFQSLRALSSNSALVVLTYPSPQYQRHLMEHDPDELQIIDQVIEREELLGAACSAGYTLRHYSLETVWKKNQYVHCVLQTNDALSAAPESSQPGLLGRIGRSIESRWEHHVLKPFRRRKYIDHVFNCS